MYKFYNNNYSLSLSHATQPTIPLLPLLNDTRTIDTPPSLMLELSHNTIVYTRMIGQRSNNKLCNCKLGDKATHSPLTPTPHSHMESVVCQLSHHSTAGTPRVVGGGLSDLRLRVRVVVNHIFTVRRRGGGEMDGSHQTVCAFPYMYMYSTCMQIYMYMYMYNRKLHCHNRTETQYMSIHVLYPLTLMYSLI